MANARREVDLVVKAKDDAAKVIDAITGALNGLLNATGKVSKEVGKTGGGISGLVSAVSELDKVLRGGSGADRLAQDLEKAQKSVTALKQALGGTEAELAELKAQASAAAASTDKLKTSVSQLEQRIEGGTAALKKANTEHAKLKKELGEQNTAVGKLTRTTGGLTNQIDKQQSKIAETTAKFQALGQEIAQTADPSARLVNEFARTEGRLDKQTAKLAELQGRLAETQGNLKEAAAAATQFGERVEQSAAGIERQKASLSSLRQELNQTKADAKAAATAQRELDDSAERAAESIARQKSQLSGAEQSYDKLTASVKQAEGSMDQLAQAARGPLAQAISAQRAIVSQISQQYARVRGELAQVGAEIGRAGVPTKAMSEEYQRLSAALREIEGEFGRQRAAFGEMRGAFSGLTGDTAQLTAVTQKFEQTLSESAAGLNRVQQAASSSAGAMGRIAADSARAAAAAEKAARSTRDVGNASDEAASKTNRLSQAYRQLHGDTRQALSYTQRLRGEVLSLVSAYGGVFGVIQALTGVVTATQKVEAAQVRLTALFDGNAQAAGNEFEFISRTANRLGIDIGELADQYTKFAAATKGTNIAGQTTRDIFLRVAEAGRVNGLSMEDMGGIFRALVQIASKGKVQLEELSGQLGDRLPGALQIMADGLGISTEKLLAMTKEGEVSSAALENFAEELERRYGDALPAALLTTNAALGRFGNAVTQAFVAFGKGGFIKGFISLLDSLTATLKSADFQAFASNISAAFGVLARTLGFLAENFRLVTVAGSAFLALKLAPFVGALALSFAKMTATTAGAATGITQVGVAAAASSTRIGLASRALVGLRAALTALLSGSGVGLLVTAVAAGIALWATRASEASEFMNRHKETVDKVKSAYDEAGGSVKLWREELQKLTLTELNRELREAREQLDAAQREVKALAITQNLPGMDFGLGNALRSQDARDQTEAMTNLAYQFRDGAIKAKPFIDAIDAINKVAADEAVTEFAEKLVTAARAAEEKEGALNEIEQILKAVTGSEEDAAEAAKQLGLTLDTVKSSTDEAAQAAESYKNALNGIKEFIPGLNEELKKMQELAKLDEFYKQLQAMPRSIEQAMQDSQLYSQARDSINSKYTDYTAKFTSTRGTPSGEEYAELVSSAQRLASQLNLSVEDILTVIHYESGFRSQIMGGAGKNYFGLFQASPDVRKQYGIGPGSSITDQVEALGKYLVDRGVKPGDSRLPIYAAINAGNAKAIHASDENNGGLPGSVLDKNVSAKMEESERIAKGLLEAYAGQVEEVKKVVEGEEKRAEKLAEIKLTEEEAAKLAEVENKFKDADLVTRTTELELEKKRLELAREGATLTPEMEASIRRRVELQEREKSNQEQINNSKKAAEESEARFTALVSQREALLKQAEAYRAQGNYSAADQATAQANNLKAAIDAAAAAAIKMWQSIGGPEAQAAIAKIQQAALESSNLANKGNAVNAMWTQVGQSLGDNLVNAFDEFAQAVANGENAWKALGRALQKAAAQFLIDIGKMIVRQMIFNALSGFFPGLQPGSNGLFHEGTGSGTVGSSLPNRTKSISPTVWAMAPRFHQGYNSGLAPNEMAAILDKSEAVMTAESPFHPNNQAKTMGAAMAAGAGGGGQNIKIVNAFDSAELLEEALNTPRGERAFLNHVRKSKSTVKEVLK